MIFTEGSSCYHRFKRVLRECARVSGRLISRDAAGVDVQEGFSVEQLPVLSLQQPSHQVKMKVDDKGPSRGSVPCGRPSAEAKEIVSITLRYHIKEK